MECKSESAVGQSEVAHAQVSSDNYGNGFVDMGFFFLDVDEA